MNLSDEDYSRNKYTKLNIYIFFISVLTRFRNVQKEFTAFVLLYIYNTCALSKHIGNMCMRLRNGGKGEALPSLFPRFAPNAHIYLYASIVHMYCIYPAILNRK